MSVRPAVLWVRFLLILLREIWSSAITVARLALGPLDNLRSGFVALPMRAESDVEITTLANSITLTPGTITVHVEPEKHVIVVHAIDIGQDPEDVRRSIQTVLEDNILRATRAGRRR